MYLFGLFLHCSSSVGCERLSWAGKEDPVPRGDMAGRREGSDGPRARNFLLQAEAGNSVLWCWRPGGGPPGVCCWGPRPADPREDRAAAGAVCTFVQSGAHGGGRSTAAVLPLYAHPSSVLSCGGQPAQLCSAAHGQTQEFNPASPARKDRDGAERPGTRYSCPGFGRMVGWRSRRWEAERLKTFLFRTWRTFPSGFPGLCGWSQPL